MYSFQLNPIAKTVEISIPGDILSTNADTVRREIHNAMDPDVTPESQWDALVLDLRCARMIDSVGLNLLVSVIKNLESRGKKLRLLTSNSHVQRALRFTRLDLLAEVVGVAAQ